MPNPVITYKDGWSFLWLDEKRLQLHRSIPNSDGGENFQDEYVIEFPDGFDLNLLTDRIHGLEYHEIQEWLRVDGEKALGPHTHDDVLLTLPSGFVGSV